MNYYKKPGSFKEQNEGFSAQIHSVALTKTLFLKKMHVNLGINFAEMFQNFLELLGDFVTAV